MRNNKGFWQEFSLTVVQGLLTPQHHLMSQHLFLGMQQLFTDFSGSLWTFPLSPLPQRPDSVSAYAVYFLHNRVPAGSALPTIHACIFSNILRGRLIFPFLTCLAAKIRQRSNSPFYCPNFPPLQLTFLYSEIISCQKKWNRNYTRIKKSSLFIIL